MSLADELYAAKLFAASRGHWLDGVLSGLVSCGCGQVFDSPADLDAHLLAEAEQ